jgi:hypothetical protein
VYPVEAICSPETLSQQPFAAATDMAGAANNRLPSAEGRGLTGETGCFPRASELRGPKGRGERYAQNSVATERKIAAQRSTSATETHSTGACAPSPPGPNRTVGISSSAISAESAQ